MKLNKHQKKNTRADRGFPNQGIYNRIRIFVRYLQSVCVLGVNLLIGTEAGLMLLDRSGQGKGIQPLIWYLSLENI